LVYCIMKNLATLRVHLRRFSLNVNMYRLKMNVFVLLRGIFSFVALKQCMIQDVDSDEDQSTPRYF
jgi:hypothetical protein